MVFYINDPQGIRIPYFPEQDFRVVRRGDNIKAVEPFDVRPVKEWEEVERDSSKKKKRMRSDQDKDELQSSKEQMITPFQLMGSTSSPALIARQIMSNGVITLLEDQTVNDAWELINQRHFRHVPVINQKGKMVGIVSDRGISKALIEGNGKLSLHSVMAHPVVSGAPETEVSHIAKVFIEHRIGSMPILDEHEKLVGIITRSDILRTLVKITPINYRI
jgi:CBS domain-containing protein